MLTSIGTRRAPPVVACTSASLPLGCPPKNDVSTSIFASKTAPLVRVPQLDHMHFIYDGTMIENRDVYLNFGGFFFQRLRQNFNLFSQSKKFIPLPYTTSSH